jgi:streptogramin lyase
MHTPALSSTVLRRTVLSMLVGLLSLPTLAQSGVGSGPAFGAPYGIALEPSGSFVVADLALDAVLRVDPVTGDRTVVSNARIGHGRGFVALYGIEVGATGSVVVADTAPHAVLQVDPVTGDRTVVSGCTAWRPSCPSGRQVGSGPPFRSPQDIVVEASGSLVVVDVILVAVLRVDPDTGDRTLLSQ